MHRTAYLLLLLTSIFWGGNAIAGKLAVGHVSPMLLTAARWGLAAIMLVRHRMAAVRSRLDPGAAEPAVPGGARDIRLHRLQHRALFGRRLHDRDQCQHRAGRHTDADLPRQFPAFQASRDLGADSRRHPVACRGGADRRPWRPGPAAWSRRQFRRCADADRRDRLCRLHRRPALQARHPLAKPDDRADRERVRHVAAFRGRRIPGRRGHRCPTRRAGPSSPIRSSSRRSWRRYSTSEASN